MITGNALAAVAMAPVGLLTLPGGERAVERRRTVVRNRSARAGDVGVGPVPRVVAVLDALIGVGLGAVCWFLLGLAALGALRGPFYGFVVAGPYDDSWGGPSLAGAWAVHAGVWVLTLPVVLALLVGLVGLQARVTTHLLGGRRRRWVLPTALLVLLAGAFLLRVWLHQL